MADIEAENWRSGSRSSRCLVILHKNFSAKNRFFGFCPLKSEIIYIFAVPKPRESTEMTYARMAESVDALVSNTNDSNVVPVRPRLRVLKELANRRALFFVAPRVLRTSPPSPITCENSRGCGAPWRGRRPRRALRAWRCAPSPPSGSVQGAFRCFWPRFPRCVPARCG